MWCFIDAKCKHYFSSILFWLVEFVAQEFYYERKDQSDGIDFTTSLLFTDICNTGSEECLVFNFWHKKKWTTVILKKYISLHFGNLFESGKAQLNIVP